MQAVDILPVFNNRRNLYGAPGFSKKATFIAGNSTSIICSMAQDLATVMYVDDMPMNLKLFEATFGRDYNIILTESPREALKILEEKEVQVLVSDQRMPEMIGTELLEIVAEKYPDIRRFLLTAYTDTETVIEAVNVGKVHGYIKKPMNNKAVRNSINNALESYYLRKKNRQILEELRLAHEELKNLDDLKSEMIQTISSELSTPLNRIMGTLHLLKNKIEGDELSKAVNILDQSVFKLEQFSLLASQISRLRSSQFKLERKKVSLKQVIQFSAIETSEELKDQDMLLNRDPESQDLEVEGDSGLLVSCVVYLIRFAREHPEDGGEISIVIRICMIEDQGILYSEAVVEFMNEYFTGESGPLDLSMGLSLAVSRLIMEAHGGQLQFTLSEEGKGQMNMIFPHE